MKKIFFCGLIFLGLALTTRLNAQNDSFKSGWSKDTREVIESIPSLITVAEEISTFQLKVEGKKSEYVNSNADSNALLDKYTRELESQILANEKNTHVIAVLNAELDRVKQMTNKK